MNWGHTESGFVQADVLGTCSSPRRWHAGTGPVRRCMLRATSAENASSLFWLTTLQCKLQCQRLRNTEVRIAAHLPARVPDRNQSEGICGSVSKIARSHIHTTYLMQYILGVHVFRTRVPPVHHHRSSQIHTYMEIHVAWLLFFFWGSRGSWLCMHVAC